MKGKILSMISGLYSLPQLQEAIASDPTQWRPLVFTNGCFDLLHVGHIRYLQIAKSCGQALIVGLNSDRSVQTIKPNRPGMPQRPIIPEIQRAELLAALKPVDAVIIFAETTATQLITALKPDIYVKGGDYTLESLPEASVVQALGSRVELIQIEIPTSTTAIINRILQTKTE
jgi:rfaE bifunctional protein nucleotidyltransferase chain/domain